MLWRGWAIEIKSKRRHELRPRRRCSGCCWVTLEARDVDENGRTGWVCHPQADAAHQAGRLHHSDHRQSWSTHRQSGRPPLCVPHICSRPDVRNAEWSRVYAMWRGVYATWSEAYAKRWVIRKCGRAGRVGACKLRRATAHGSSAAVSRREVSIFRSLNLQITELRTCR